MLDEFDIRDIGSDSRELHFVECLLQESSNKKIDDSLSYNESNYQSNQSYRFVPDHRVLIEQIDKAQEEAQFYHQQFLHMKAVNESIIDALKRVFSSQVANELQKAMQINKKFSFMKRKKQTSQYSSLDSNENNFQNQYCQRKSISKKQFECNPNSKYNNKNLSNFHNKKLDSENSRQGSKELLSQTLYQIMINKKQGMNINQRRSSSKIKESIKKVNNNNNQRDLEINQNKSYSKLDLKEKKSTKNVQLQFSDQKNNSFFVLTPSKKSISGNNSLLVISPKKQSILKNSIKREPLSPLFTSNQQNLEYQNHSNLKLNFNFKDTSQISTNRTNTPQSIATSLLCEVCHQCFSPNQFFKHIQVCNQDVQTQKSFQSIGTLNDTQNLEHQRAALNYTIMMKNLVQMKSQIQSQIEMLKTSKQKIDRATLRKKLQKDLQKVTKIIMKKENELKGFAYSPNGVCLSSLGKKKKSVLSKK